MNNVSSREEQKSEQDHTRSRRRHLGGGLAVLGLATTLFVGTGIKSRADFNDSTARAEAEAMEPENMRVLNQKFTLNEGVILRKNPVRLQVEFGHSDNEELVVGEEGLSIVYPVETTAPDIVRGDEDSTWFTFTVTDSQTGNPEQVWMSGEIFEQKTISGQHYVEIEDIESLGPISYNDLIISDDIFTVGAVQVASEFITK